MLEYIYTNFIDRAPIALWGIFFVIGLTLEQLLPSAVRKKNSLSPYLNFSHSLIYLSVIFVINLQFISIANRIIDDNHISSVLKLESFVDGSTLGFIFITCLSALLLDLILYWWHRAEHTIPFLWDVHAVHHSDEELNAFSSTREVWFENFIRLIFAIVLMKIVLGVSSGSVIVAASLFAGINFVNHCNIRLDTGFLYWLVATPQFERIHHSIETRHQYKNFSGIFSIWDSVFGTLYIPEKDEYPETGVKGVHIENVIDFYLFPIRRWYRRLVGYNLTV